MSGSTQERKIRAGVRLRDVAPEYVQLPSGVRASVLAPNSVAYEPRPGHVVIGFGTHPSNGQVRRTDSPLDNPGWHVALAIGDGGIGDGSARLRLFPNGNIGRRPAREQEVAGLRTAGGDEFDPSADLTGVVFDARSSQRLLDFLLGQQAPKEA